VRTRLRHPGVRSSLRFVVSGVSHDRPAPHGVRRDIPCQRLSHSWSETAAGLSRGGRVEINYASAGAADPDAIKGPLPKTIVNEVQRSSTKFNEVQLLIGGPVGARGSYWLEPYFISGGFPDVARDAWYAQRLTDDGARTPITVRAGQFTLPLPLDPETFRETIMPYAVWGQTAAVNPFNFFSPKIGT